MFGKKFSFWHRLLGHTPETGGEKSASAERDRRTWARHLANREITYQQAGLHDPSPLKARICDISRGGIKLLINRRLQEGDLLSIDLPVAEEQGPHTVLACVVRITLCGAEEWSVGCIFSRELEDEDLQGLGARREKPAPSDQRTWMRFPCQVQAAFQGVGENSEKKPAQVLNISANGIGLLVPQLVEMGTLLSVELVPAAGAPPRTMLACVVHASRQASGQWALGCNFIRELSEADLLALVA